MVDAGGTGRVGQGAAGTREKPWIDTERMGAGGGSYGGYATLAGLTFTPEKFACGVDIVGPSNLVTLLSSIPPYWTSLLDEFSKIKSSDVILPIRIEADETRELCLRCVTEPDAEQKLLLHRLGFTLPKRLGSHFATKDCSEDF